MKGAFIAIEGIDGCGKGTVITRLTQDLFNANKDNHIFLTREPYKRDWLKDFLSRLDPLSQGEDALKLFVEDRTKHCAIMKTMLNKGSIILCDRYKYSTYAYQMAQDMPFEKIHELHKELLVPDLTIVIDIPVEEAVRRMTEGREQDAHAFHKAEFLAKVRENYLKLKELLGENITFIDGNRDREAVYADSLKTVQTLLKNRK